MPLSDTIVQTQATPVGNAITIGGVNNIFFGNVSLQQWRNRTLTLQDYYAGSVQFMQLITFVMTVNPLADLGIVIGNPSRQRYGELCIKNLDGHVVKNYFLEYEKQQIQFLLPTINLPRQEASRQKQYALSERPRFLASSSLVQDFPISGQIQTTNADYSGSGLLLGTASATFTENGSITSRGGNVPPTLRFPQRGAKFDITDGKLALTDIGTLNSYYSFDFYNENLERWLPDEASFYLLPGAVGTVQVSYVKLNETGSVGANPFPPYASTATFPQL